MLCVIAFPEATKQRRQKIQQLIAKVYQHTITLKMADVVFTQVMPGKSSIVTTSSTSNALPGKAVVKR